MKKIEYGDARRLFNSNFFGFEEWNETFQIPLGESELRRALVLPWNKHSLEAHCKFCSLPIPECHFLFWVPSKLDKRFISILGLQQYFVESKTPVFASRIPVAWYQDQRFATREYLPSRWWLLHRTIALQGSTASVKKRLSPEYKLAPAIAEVVKNILLCVKQSEYVNTGIFAVTSSRSDDGRTIGVQHDAHHEIAIIDHKVWGKNPANGLSATRIPGK